MDETIIMNRQKSVTKYSKVNLFIAEILYYQFSHAVYHYTFIVTFILDIITRINSNEDGLKDKETDAQIVAYESLDYDMLLPIG